MSVPAVTPSASDTPPAPERFYITGGTVPADAASYVMRSADDELLAGLLAGDYCYVLNTRQMGKSSLCARTIARLGEKNVHTVFLDLTRFGGHNVTPEQWYAGLLAEAGRTLGLRREFVAYWKENAHLPCVSRFFGALREVGLESLPEPIVLFVDEIDASLSLPFSTDEFFAALRECYNRRISDGEMNRLTFCLLGVATPADLISDTRMSPFNIGRRIALTDFSPDEAAPLAQGLGTGGQAVLDRILYWTGGHPYLTQRLCRSLSEQADQIAPPIARVDALCDQLFLSRSARDADDNLAFVRNRLLRSDEDLASLLDLFTQVRRSKKVRDDETNPLCSVLRLSGVCCVKGDFLTVRNRIYDRVFDADWVTAHMPDAELRRQKAAYRRGMIRAGLVGGTLAAAFAALTVFAAFNVRTARVALAQVKAAQKRADENANRANINANRANTNAQRARANAAQAQQNAGRADKNASKASASLLLANRESQRANGEALRAAAEARRAVRGEAAAKTAQAEAQNLALARQAAVIEAKKQENLARASGLSERTARRLGQRYLYDADIQLAAQLWENPDGATSSVLQLLRSHIPAKNEPDDREITWHLLMNRVQQAGAKVTWQPSNKQAEQTGYQYVPDDSSDVMTSDNQGRVWRYRVNTADTVLVIDIKQKFPKVSAVNLVKGTKDIVEGDTDGTLRRVRKDGTIVWVTHPLQETIVFISSPTDDLVQFVFTLDKNNANGIACTCVDGESGKTLPLEANSWILLIKDAWENAPRYFSTLKKPLCIPHANRFVLQKTNAVLTLVDAARQKAGLPFFALMGHNATVRSTAFSPNGDTLYSGDGSGLVIAWDTVTGRQKIRWIAHPSLISSMEISPDGRTLLTGAADGGVRSWNAQTGTLTGVYKGHSAPIDCGLFTADGKKFTTFDSDGLVRQWDTPLAQVRGNQAASSADTSQASFFDLVSLPFFIYDFAYSPDATHIAVPEAKRVTLFDAHTGAVTARLQTAGADSTTSVAFSPNGKLLAGGGSEGTIYLWDAQNGTLKATWKPAPSASLLSKESGIRTIGDLAFSPDGRLLAVGVGTGVQYITDEPQILRVYDVESHKEIAALKGLNGACPRVVFSPDQAYLAVACQDGTVSVWDARSGSPTRWTRVLHYRASASPMPMNCVAWARDSHALIAGGDAGTLFYWTTGKWRDAPGAWKAHSGRIHDVAFSPDNKTLASAAWDNTVKLWDTSTHRELLTVNGYKKWVQRVKFSPDGKTLATGDADGHVRLWEGTTPPPTTRATRLAVQQKQVQVAGLQREGNTAERAMQWDKAIEILTQLINVDDSLKPVYLFRRGTAYAQLGQFTRAAADYQKITNPGNKDQMFLARALLAAGDVAGYRALCRQVLGANPDATGSLANSVAWICSLAPDAVSDMAPVLRLAERSVAQQKQAYNLGTLGIVLYRVGRYEEANTRLNESNTQQHDPENDLFIALCLWKMNQKNAARKKLHDARARLGAEPTPPGDWEMGVERGLFLREALSIITGDDVPPLSDTEKALLAP